jgi:hypothetical protein
VDVFTSFAGFAASSLTGAPCSSPRHFPRDPEDVVDVRVLLPPRESAVRAHTKEFRDA